MSGSTILVVDDERNIVQLARLYLRNEGYQVETAANGREALEKVRQTSPSLILLDLMMPIMDGWEVCKTLRKTSDVPIIMLTARDDDIDKVVGLELGADDVVSLVLEELTQPLANVGVVVDHKDPIAVAGHRCPLVSPRTRRRCYVHPTPEWRKKCATFITGARVGQLLTRSAFRKKADCDCGAR